MISSRIRKPTTIAGRLIAFSLVYATAALVVASAVLGLIIASSEGSVDQRLSVKIEAVRNAMKIGADGSLGVDGNLDGPHSIAPAPGGIGR